MCTLDSKYNYPGDIPMLVTLRLWQRATDKLCTEGLLENPKCVQKNWAFGPKRIMTTWTPNFFSTPTDQFVMACAAQSFLSAIPTAKRIMS